MSKIHNIIEEIAQVRERKLIGRAFAELPIRLSAIQKAFKEHDKKNEELTRYFPVALVACIEGYFRIAIKELIDAGEPYISNAEKPPTSFKIDFGVLRAIHGSTVTVGELIGHSVPLSRLEHISNTMSSLLDEPFLDRMKKVCDRVDHEVNGAPLKPMINNPDKVFAGVTKTFELRHIICHEIASAHSIKFEEVAECFECCVVFLKATDELLFQMLHPNAPLTQSEMNISAQMSLDKSRLAMNHVIDEVKAELSAEQLVAFDEAQALWEKTCMSWAEFETMLMRGGSIWPTVRCSSEEAIVKARIQQLMTYQNSFC